MILTLNESNGFGSGNLIADRCSLWDSLMNYPTVISEVRGYLSRFFAYSFTRFFDLLFPTSRGFYEGLEES